MRRCLLLAVLTTLAITVGLFVYRFLFSYTYDNSLEGLSDEDLAVSAKPASGITNIALFGIDTRPDEPTRSEDVYKRQGYTYDWGKTGDDHYGLTEFVIPSGVKVTVKDTFTNEEAITRLRKGTLE